MKPLALAGFLTALAATHAVIAAYCLLLYGRPREPPSSRRALDSSPPPRSDEKGAGKPGEPRRDRALAVFGLLDVAVVALDAGLAWSHTAGPEGARAALVFAHGGLIAAAILLVDFVLLYARVRRPPWSVALLYGAGGFFLVADVLGLLHRHAEIAATQVRVLGLDLLVVRAPATPLGAAFAVAWAAGVVACVVVLARALLRGRREAIILAGMGLLAIASIHDALAALGASSGPLLCPYGYWAFVNGVMMTLLTRFTTLRRELEARAAELRARTGELSRANDDLRAAQDELVRKEQLAAVGELSAVIAHEVRNPLAIISNAVASLRRPGIEADDRGTLLQILDEESSRLNRLVGDLLRYARPVNLERQQISLRELVERSLVLAQRRPDLDVELCEPEPVERVLGDANLLRQVIDNLITNAVQAMSGGGTLTLSLANLLHEGKRGVELKIQDTGEGMNTSVRSRALDPFFTTRPSGTGLGLAIVARIVDAHGGVLQIRSKAGEGTSVHVFLPIASDAPPSRSPERPSSLPPMPAELRKAIRHEP